MSARHSPLQNCLLAALPEDSRKRVFPHLERKSLALGKVLYDPGDRMPYAYFPTDSIVSLLYRMENGASGEISVVGYEGVVGVSLFMGGDSTPSQAIVQSAGNAYRLAAGRIQNEFGRHGEMLKLMLRYTQSLITQMTQTAACNRHHSIDEQMARWLLLSLDRLEGTTMTMTQQLIANMLSVTPERVTEVARKLQKLGVISYRRGEIRVRDRPTLEKLSCECYAVLRDETDRLLSCAPRISRPKRSRSARARTAARAPRNAGSR
jgi:CRP-like cAMP-binding protein